MFYIRKDSIKEGHNSAFVAHLLQVENDTHVGMVENPGYGKETTFLGTTPYVDKVVQTVAEHFSITVPELMEYYFDIADGHEGCTNKDKVLIKAIPSYKPE